MRWIVSFPLRGPRRPIFSRSPYGGAMFYAYATSLPFQQTKTGPDGFTRTALDGPGRTIRVERGYSASNIQSVVDTVSLIVRHGPLRSSNLAHPDILQFASVIGHQWQFRDPEQRADRAYGEFVHFIKVLKH